MNLYEGDEIQSAYDGISIAVNEISQISDLNPQLKSIYDTLNEIMYSRRYGTRNKKRVRRNG